MEFISKEINEPKNKPPTLASCIRLLSDNQKLFTENLSRSKNGKNVLKTPNELLFSTIMFFLELREFIKDSSIFIFGNILLSTLPKYQEEILLFLELQATGLFTDIKDSSSKDVNAKKDRQVRLICEVCCLVAPSISNVN